VKAAKPGDSTVDVSAAHGSYVLVFLTRLPAEPACSGRYPYQGRIAEASLVAG
jgi:hypothetical protein